MAVTLHYPPLHHPQFPWGCVASELAWGWLHACCSWHVTWEAPSIVCFRHYLHGALSAHPLTPEHALSLIWKCGMQVRSRDPDSRAVVIEERPYTTDDGPSDGPGPSDSWDSNDPEALRLRPGDAHPYAWVQRLRDVPDKVCLYALEMAWPLTRRKLFKPLLSAQACAYH